MHAEHKANNRSATTSVFIPATQFNNDDCALTRESRNEYHNTVKCSVCYNASAEWCASARPINIVLRTKMPRASICIAGLECNIWKQSLAQATKTYLKKSGAVFGKCEILRHGKIVPLEEYVTVYCPIQKTIEAARGRFCRHFSCKGCGCIYNNVHWACGGVLRTTLDQRDIYFDSGSNPIFTQRVVDLIRDDIRFKDLKYAELDVLDKPLDGDILPGDPGWTGILKARRVPPLPTGKPTRSGCWK